MARKLEKLLTKDFRCVVQITGVESKTESEIVYREFKDKAHMQFK